jgi:hypothetical protein
MPSYRVKCACVIAKNSEGKLRHYYGNSDHLGAPVNYGSVIPWLSDEQAEHLLKLGLVERIEENPVEITNVDSDPLVGCLKALESLEVDLSAGAPTCRSALRDGGFRYGNDVVAEAVKARKDALRALSGTAR